MQGKRFLLAIVGGLAAITIATPALAIMSVPNGWYLEGNLGSTHVSNKNYNGSSSTSGLGGNVDLGYKFMPYLGMELGYSRYADTSIKDDYGNKAATVKLYSYDIAGRGIVPLSDTGFELFAKLGAARVNAHPSIQNTQAADNIGFGSGEHSATALYYGVGAQYYWIPELAIIVQWQSAQGNSTTGAPSLISGGLSFIFD